MNKLLIRRVLLLDPLHEKSRITDILMQGDRVTRIAENIHCPDAQVISGSGLMAAPGLVDMHVHLRDPGQTHKEDILSGCAAAAAGGFTSVAAMPNTAPVADSERIIRYIIDKGRGAKARVYPVASITRGMQGKQLTDFGALKKAGAVAVSDDGRPVVNAHMMMECMRAAAMLQMPVLSHCEEDTLAAGGIINDGAVSRKLGVVGIPAAAEDVIIAREIALSAASGKPVHICHVSTATGADLIRDAKRRGVPVTAETAPHYFTLTENELLRRNANFRMNPPLRTGEDRQAIIKALCDGTLDAIATDHAPHTQDEKADFLRAPNGVIGLETAFALGFTMLVQPGHMDLYRLIRLLSVNPARILGIPGGNLQEEVPADIVLFNEAQFTVNKESFRSAARNTPFDGMKLSGKIHYTICRGEISYRAEELEE